MYLSSKLQYNIGKIFNRKRYILILSDDLNPGFLTNYNIIYFSNKLKEDEILI